MPIAKQARKIATSPFRQRLCGSLLVLTALTLTAPVGAEIILQGDTFSVRESKAVPKHGHRQAEVLARHGEPLHRHQAVGTPPISSWEYPGFEVYFENDIVLHSVIKVAGR